MAALATAHTREPQSTSVADIVRIAEAIDGITDS